MGAKHYLLQFFAQIIMRKSKSWLQWQSLSFSYVSLELCLSWIQNIILNT